MRRVRVLRPRRLVAEAPFHRLWYDLRSQSPFDQPFRNDIATIDRGRDEMIWRIAPATQNSTTVR